MRRSLDRRRHELCCGIRQRSPGPHGRFAGRRRTNLAPRPMEMVLIGTGACTAYDVVLILKRGRHRVRSCEVNVQAERAPTDPKVFTSIAFRFTVRGEKLDPAAVERAVALSHEKYCSATVMLAATARITHETDDQI